ncbi:Calx-beta domain-containing protein [Pleionea sediminis]|uniref:Calx-beta domain-containing protein n=1 Tax=Pleionea sediminis TaxID=2569479 RepID=UPI001185DA98|nr:S8 family serine peptidase [Pleionea sediminis]
MVTKFKYQLIASAVISAFTTLATADMPNSQTNSTETDVTRYIVTYKKSALPLAKTTDKIEYETFQAARALEAKGIPVKRELRSHASIAVELTPERLNELKADPQVASIVEDHKRFPMAIYNDSPGSPYDVQVTPYAVFQSQADQLQLQDGQKVCVIDSGLAGAEGETGGRNDDFEWAVITGDNDSVSGNWNEDGGSHGTHVAGTIGAADNDFGVIGMAPGVPMHIIKVFNNAGWSYSSDLAYAVGKCADAGANIINMSLGGPNSNPVEQNAFDTFTENGGLAIAAAGNDGREIAPERKYPAGYDSVMMVGANDANNNHADFSESPSCNATKTNCVEVTAGGESVLSTIPHDQDYHGILRAEGASYRVSAFENSGTAQGETYFMGLGTATDAAADGKICLIDRGEITFHDKVKNCEDSGGIGAVIINNEEGPLQGTLGEPNNTIIPTVGALLTDRTALLDATTATITYAISRSSYGTQSGTSMATPAVTGIAALVWSNHPNCTGAEIRTALKATAEDSGAPGHDVYFGNGIVKAKAASDYLSENRCNGASAAGTIQLETTSTTVSEDAGSVTITIERINGFEGEVTFDVTTSNGAATAGEDYTAVNQTVLMADGETSTTVSIDIIDDSEYEGETAESFNVSLSNASENTSIQQPSSMQVNITDNDPILEAGDFALSSATYSAAENSAGITITINRVNGDSGAASVTISSSNGTATSGSDYTSVNQVVSFADGETSKQITIALIDDSNFEGDESFTVTLSNPSANSTINSPATATVTIRENDLEAGDGNSDDSNDSGGSINWLVLLSLLAFRLGRVSTTK